ncbi:7161_t:CDS:1, partial [Acaulospora morrowiae]
EITQETDDKEESGDEERIWDEIIYKEEDVDEREGYYAREMCGETDIQDQQQLDLSGPAAYLAQIEELPTSPEEEQEGEPTVEEVIGAMKLDEELEKGQAEQARELLFREQDIFAQSVLELGCTEM